MAEQSHDLAPASSAVMQAFVITVPTIFTCPRPAQIAYAESHAALQAGQVQALSISAFENIIRAQPERAHFTWSETISVEPSLLPLTIQAKPQVLSGQYAGSVADLVIVPMDAQVGYGVGTARPISSGTIVTHYAGAILNQSHNSRLHARSSTYRMHYADNFTIDARECGNMASFIQDAPTVLELPKFFQLQTEVKARAAVANVAFDSGMLAGVKVVFVRALRDIRAGEMLLVDYGQSYWHMLKYLFDVERRLFAADATLLPAHAYAYQRELINLKQENAEFVKLPYAAFVRASARGVPLAYHFTDADGRVHHRTLARADTALIASDMMWTARIGARPIYLRPYLTRRLQAEYRLRALVHLAPNNFYQAFQREGLALKTERAHAVEVDDYATIIAHLLQALLLAIKGRARAQVEANLYAELAAAYAAQAELKQQPAYLDAAIYLQKKALQVDYSADQAACLRSYKKQWRAHGTSVFRIPQYLIKFLTDRRTRK